jgi:hypothetical protein
LKVEQKEGWRKKKNEEEEERIERVRWERAKEIRNE